MEVHLEVEGQGNPIWISLILLYSAVNSPWLHFHQTQISVPVVPISIMKQLFNPDRNNYIKLLMATIFKLVFITIIDSQITNL